MNAKLSRFQYVLFTSICIVLLAAYSNVKASHDSFPVYPGGPNPQSAPTIDCIAGLYETEHVVTEGRNGRYTQYRVTGSHRFDAANVIFDGIESDGDTLQHWPISIKVDDDKARPTTITTDVNRQIAYEEGSLSGNSKRRSRRYSYYSVNVPVDVSLLQFHLQFDVADPDRRLYMKLTSPDGESTFYDQSTSSAESASIEMPKAGTWDIRVSMKANTSMNVDYTLQVNAQTLESEVVDGTAGCWYGGIIYGAWDENGYGVERISDSDKVTWEDPYHHSGGITLELDNFLFEDISILSHGDGIRSNGHNNVIDSAYVADIHDDCVENDNLGSLLITDSFFDGCYAAFSARTFDDSGYDGSDNLFEIRDSLVRLEAQPTVYKPEKYGAGPGHGQFFKWDSDPDIAIKLSLHNTIFLASQENRHGGGLGVEEISHLESCSNNVIVWTGAGAFPNADELPSCFRVTTNYDEWDAAVAAWRTRHPGRPIHP